jgi:hypothetical protein
MAVMQGIYTDAEGVPHKAAIPVDENGVPQIGALSNVAVSTLLDAVTATQTGDAVAVARHARAIQATVTGSGAVSAAVSIYGNNGNANSGGVLLGTITLSGTDSDTDGFASDAPWPYLYADLTAISGTGAAVTATVGV